MLLRSSRDGGSAKWPRRQKRQERPSVRLVEPERPARFWSLLLPPQYPSNRR